MSLLTKIRFKKRTQMVSMISDYSKVSHEDLHYGQYLSEASLLTGNRYLDF